MSDSLKKLSSLFENHQTPCGDHEHGDKEMAKKHLYNIAKNSAEIFNALCEDECHLESWHESLIAQAADDIDAVSNSLSYLTSYVYAENLDKHHTKTPTIKEKEFTKWKKQK